MTDAMAALAALAIKTNGITLVVGHPHRDGRKRYNAASVLRGGKIIATYLKRELPNYKEFDEKRYFMPGPLPEPVLFKGAMLGLPICEDIWGEDVVECLAETGAEILLVPNGSPYWRGKHEERVQVAVSRVTESGLLDEPSIDDDTVVGLGHHRELT